MTIAIVIYIIICVGLVGLILLQQNQGGGLGILGGSSDSILGTAQESFLSKVIKFMAILFVVGAIFLSVMSAGDKSIIDEEEEVPQEIQEEVPSLEEEDANFDLPAEDNDVDTNLNLEEELPSLEDSPNEELIIPPTREK